MHYDTADGRKVLDGTAGLWCVNAGHARPKIVKAVQDQVAQIQQQVAAKRAELEEQKRNLLQQQAQVRELEMDQIVEQGQLESSCELKVGDNLVQKMQVAIVVKDGVVQSIEEA